MNLSSLSDAFAGVNAFALVPRYSYLRGFSVLCLFLFLRYATRGVSMYMYYVIVTLIPLLFYPRSARRGVAMYI